MRNIQIILFSQYSNISYICNKIIVSKPFENLTLLVILLNCVILALDDPTTDTDDAQRQSIDLILLILYTVEMGLKIIALGFIFNKDSYMRDLWNILDITIIITGYLPYVVNTNQINLSAIRSLRVLRPLRTISRIKSLKQILNTLFSSLSLLKDAIIILIFFYLVFAIAGQQLFSGSLKKRCFDSSTGIQLGDNLNNLILCSDDTECNFYYSNSGIGVGLDQPSYVCSKGMSSPFWDIENFDTFGWSLLNVYVVVSQEGWSTTQAHVQQTFGYPSFIYFFFCVLIGNMFLENLLMAIIQIKYQESERLLKKKYRVVEDLKSHNIADFIRWGIYKSNKQRYRELEAEKYRRKSTFGEIINFFKQRTSFMKMFTLSKSKSSGDIMKEQQNNLNQLQIKSENQIEDDSSSKNQEFQVGESIKDLQKEIPDKRIKVDQSKPFIQSDLEDANDNNIPTQKDCQETNQNLLRIPVSAFRPSQISLLNNYNSNNTPSSNMVAQTNKQRYSNLGFGTILQDELNVDLPQNNKQKSIYIKDLQQLNSAQNTQFPKLNPIKRPIQVLKKSNKEFKSQSPRGFQRKNSRKMTTKQGIVIKPLEGTTHDIQKKTYKQNISMMKSAKLKEPSYLKESVHQSDKNLREDQNLGRLRSEERYDTSFKKSFVNNSNMRSSGREQAQQKEINLIKDISRNSDNQQIQFLPQSQQSSHPTIILQPSLILKSKQSRKMVDNMRKDNRNNALVIPARQVESDEEGEANNESYFENDDEEFLKEIERTEQYNQRLQNQLENGNQIENQLIQKILKDREIEKNYRTKTFTIQNLIKQPINEQQLQQEDNSSKNISLKSIQENSLQVIQSDQLIHPLRMYQKSSFKKKQQKQNSLEEQNGFRQYDPESPKRVMMNKRVVSTKLINQINNSSLTSKKIQDSDQMSNISEISYNEIKLQKKSSSQTNGGHQENYHPSIFQREKKPQEKIDDNLFYDEDFYNYQQKNDKLISKKNSIASQSTKEKKKEDNKMKNTKDNQAIEKQKTNIMNQVLSKDEGELYRKIFLGKDLIARVLYKEPEDYEEEILPKEKLIKKEKKRQDRQEKLKKIKFQINYQAEKRIKLRSQIVEEKKRRMDKMKILPIKPTFTAKSLIFQQTKVFTEGANPLDAALIQKQKNSETLIGQATMQKQKTFNDYQSQGTFNRAPSIVQYLMKTQGINFQNQKIPSQQLIDGSVKQYKANKTTKSKSIQSLDYIENEEKIKNGSIMIPDSDGVSQVQKDSQQSIPPENNFNQVSNQPINSNQNTEYLNSPQKIEVNKPAFATKSILKIKTLPYSSSNLNLELARSITGKQQDNASSLGRSNKINSPAAKRTNHNGTPNGKNYGDQPIFDWNLIKARQIVFPTQQEDDSISHKQSELSQVFGENLSIYHSILDQSKSRHSLGSSSNTSRPGESFATSNKEATLSVSSNSLHSISTHFKTGNLDETQGNDSQSKKSKNSKKKDDPNNKSNNGDKSNDGNQNKNEEGKVDQLKKPQTIEEFLKEPIESEYIHIVKQQVNNLLIKGVSKIKLNWSGDEVLSFTKIHKQQKTISVLLKSLNYNTQIIEQNEGGVLGIFQAFRRRVKMLIQNSVYENLILICVVINTVILSLDGSVDNQEVFDKFNEIFTYIFAIDMGLKMLGLGISTYCSDKMNIFDAIIVALSIFDMAFLTGTQGGSSFSAFRSVRILRVFRVLRVTRILRQLMFMKILIKVISSIMDKLVYILLLLLLYIFIYTLIGMQIYGGLFQNVSRSNRMIFDSFLEASFSVYDILTIENWNVILQVALRTNVSIGITCFYLISCIFIGNFIIMNLVLATMIGAFNSGQFEKEKNEIGNSVEVIEDLDLNHTSTLNSTTFMNLSNSQYGSHSRLNSSHHSNSLKNRARAISGSSQGYSDEHSFNDTSQHSGSKKKFKTQKETLSQENKEKAVSSVSDSHNHSQDNRSNHNQELIPVEDQNHEKHENNIFKQQNKNEEEVEKEKIFEFFDNIKCKRALYIFSMENRFRRGCYYIVKHSYFENIILTGIMLNSIKLVSDTYLDSEGTQKDVSYILDIVFSVFFSIESALKIISYGFLFDENSYLRDNWSQLDFFVVITSIIDVSLTNVNLGAIKILRLLRTLRPLRILHHNKSMKLIVTTLLESMAGILNMLLVLFLVWQDFLSQLYFTQLILSLALFQRLMFAILGVSLMKEKLQYCQFPNDGNNYNIYQYDSASCGLIGGTWTTYDLNFDNVLQALLTLFVLSTFEGWPTYVYNFLDASSSGPVYFGSSYFAVYIVVFILVGSFFSIDLFGAVLAFHYDIALQKSKNKYLSSEQAQWIELQRLILKSKPDYNSISSPTNKYRKFIWKICESSYLEIFIMVCIIGNILSMSLGYDTSPSSYDESLQSVNLAFTSVFLLECMLKLIAYGVNGYFFKTSNQFDFFVVSVSILDIIFTYSGQSLIKFLSAGPQIARIFRVFRVTRLLRLVKQFEGLQKLMSTLIYALPSLTNATALLLLIYFIFSILACFLFSSYQSGNSIDSFQNFSTFHRSYLLLFRLSTGEDWYIVMFDIIHQTSKWSAVFFVVFIIIQQFIMMNLFVLIIIEQFENNYINPDNPLNDFQYSEEDFKKQWVLFTRTNFGVKIHERFVTDFYFSTMRPLGFGKITYYL